MKMENVNSLVKDALSNAMMKITVELGAAKKTVKEVFAMVEGSILELDKLAGEPVDVLANGVLIAKGEVVVIDEYFGVRITEISETTASGQSDLKQPAPQPPEPPKPTNEEAALEADADSLEEVLDKAIEEST